MSARLVTALILVFLLPISVQAAPVLRGKHAIANQYIVVIKPDKVRRSNDLSASVKSRPTVFEFADRRAKAHGAKLDRIFEHAVKGFSVRMTPQQADVLAADPSILLVEEDQIITIDTTETNATWGLDRIDQSDLPLNGTYNYDTTASNVYAYVIDTGIYFPHNEFGGRALLGYDAMNDGRNGVDCNGHGTHVAGTIGGSVYGVAKGVNLYAVRVLDCSGSGTTSSVIAGIDWVTANHKSPAVANMSLGGAASAALDNAVRNSIASGVIYAVAAGNSNADACASSPSRVTEAIIVGASSSTDARASFSNYGSCVDLFAPGVNITSAWYTGTNATAVLSGTSMATPHTAGAAALYLAQNPAKAPADVEAAVKANTVSGRLSAIGTGSPNLLLQSLFTNNTPSQAAALTNGTAVTNIADTAGGNRYYTITVPVGATNLQVTTSGGSGNVDLYLRADAAPTTSTFDCRSTASDNTESCVIPSPTASTYYVMLNAASSYSGVSLTAQYSAPAANQPPLANFTTTVNGLQVTFNDTSTDPDGTIVAWQWIFGDGGSATVRIPAHTYPAAGNYTVSLTVTDDRGATNTRTTVITVTSPATASAPCTSCQSYTGTLSAGQTVYQPNGTYYYSGTAGVHEGWLQGPAGTNFNLTLLRWNGRAWVATASSAGSTSSEHIRYNGTAGYYAWMLTSRSGGGNYTFWLIKP